MAQQFAVYGLDDQTAAFCRHALAAGDRCTAICEVDISNYADLVALKQLPSVENLALSQKVDYLLIGGDADQVARRLAEALKFTTVNLVVATPAGNKPETLHEFALARSETGIRALFLSKELDHPAVIAAKRWLAEERNGALRWIELQLPFDRDAPQGVRFVHGWTWIREMAGEILSVSASTPGRSEEAPAKPIAQAAATFESDQGILGTVRYLAGRTTISARLETTTGLLEIEAPADFTGPTELRWTGDSGARAEIVAADDVGKRWFEQWRDAKDSDDKRCWSHALRQLELGDAVERSLRRRRPVALDQEEFSQAAGFKSVMTTWGCSLIWLTILIAILAASGVPFVKYLVLPAMLLFLGLQSLGWLLRDKSPSTVELRSATADDVKSQAG